MHINHNKLWQREDMPSGVRCRSAGSGLQLDASLRVNFENAGKNALS